MGVSVYLKGDYEDFYALSRQKNKANSKPILFSPQIYLGVLKKQSQFAGWANRRKVLCERELRRNSSGLGCEKQSQTKPIFSFSILSSADCEWIPDGVDACESRCGNDKQQESTLILRLRSG